MATDFVAVRCNGCHRLIGIGPSNPRIYCDALCADDYPASSREGRDALVEQIYYAQHPTKVFLAKAFGVTRQMVEQILNNRSLKWAQPH